MSGNFDPASFIDAVVTDANSIVSTPVPIGEHQAVAGEVKIESWVSKDGTKSGLRAEIPWTIEDNAAVTAVTGRPKNIVRQSIMLDLSADGKGLDMGKGMNVQLGKVREATGLNTPGQPFSFRMIQGRPAKIKVEHEPYNGQLYAKVGAVAKAG